MSKKVMLLQLNYIAINNSISSIAFLDPSGGGGDFFKLQIQEYWLKIFIVYADFSKLLVVAFYKKPDPLTPAFSSAKKNRIYCNHAVGRAQLFQLDLFSLESILLKQLLFRMDALNQMTRRKFHLAHKGAFAQGSRQARPSAQHPMYVSGSRNVSETSCQLQPSCVQQSENQYKVAHHGC